MRRPRPHDAARAALLAALVLTSACVPIGRQDTPSEAPLEPQFAPATPLPSASATTSPATERGVTPTSSVTATDRPTRDETPTTAPTSSPTSAAAPFTGSATVTDDPSDRTATVEPSPDWADLETVTVERDGDRMQLTIGLTGGAPDAAPDDQHTMNIATFFDVDGDGHLDYEIWANVSTSGWGTSYFDNVEGRALFADEDGIDIEVVDGTVVMTFDASKIASAERFRFATSSEYGRYETIGTELMARDDAPDDDQPAHFPG